MAGTKRILGVPLMYFFITMLFLMFWLTAVLSVHSIGQIEGNNSVFPQYRSVNVIGDENEKVARTKSYLFWYMIFGVLWVTAFLRAQSSFITMVSASTYYFNSNPKAPEGE